MISPPPHHTPKSKAWAARISFVLAGILLLTGCPKRETAVQAGNRTQTLLISIDADPPDLDPHTNNSLVARFVTSALFEGLVNLANDGVTIKPGVAERWDISADGLSYTFHLRTGAEWSNGDPITAQDFVAAFQRFLEPKLGCESANSVYAIVGARDYVEGKTHDFSTVGVTAPDERTVVFRLRHRTPYFLSLLTSTHLVPVHGPSLDRFNGRTQRGGQWTKPGNLVSNGPFILQEWRQNAVLGLVRNPRYWNAQDVKLQAVQFFSIEDASTEERAFRSGQLHVTYTLSSAKLQAYAERQAPELRSTAILRTEYLTFNTTRAPYSDPRVRRAFSLAIDRDRLTNSVIKGRGQAAYTMVRSGTGGYELPAQAGYDPTEAKRLLAEAGFPAGKGFPTVELTLSSQNEVMSTFAQALQQMWQETLGVNVQLLPTEFKVWLSILRSRTFTVTTDNLSTSINDPIELLMPGFTGSPNNDSGWSNADYDAAFARVESALDEKSRRQAIIDCERLIGQETPYAPVYYPIRSNLVQPSVRGWRGNPVQVIDWTSVSLVE